MRSLPRIHRRRLHFLVVAFVVASTWTASADSQPSARSVAAHAFRGNRGEALLTWRPSSSAVEIAFADGSAAARVEGNRVTYWLSSDSRETIRYHLHGLWRDLAMRFGASQAQVRTALSTFPTTRARKTLGLLNSSPPIVSTVDDYGTDAGSVGAASSYPVYYSGGAIDGFTLVKAEIVDVKDTRRNTDSGRVASFVYSSDPSRVGLDDHQLVLTVAPKSSSWGAIYATSLSAGWSKLDRGPIRAEKINEGQVAFCVNAVCGNATSTTPLDLNKWGAFVAALKRATR